MDRDYNNMTIVELRALARASRPKSYTRLRKSGLIAFLQDKAIPARPVRPSNMHYDSFRMVELTDLLREREFEGLFQAEKGWVNHPPLEEWADAHTIGLH